MGILFAMKRILICVASLAVVAAAAAKAPEGAITPDMMKEIRTSYDAGSATDRALRNALSATDMNTLALDATKQNGFDTHFSHKVESKGITDQQSSGRCWLFTGLNVLRAQMMTAHNLPELKLSQNYNFFWDQLEKANLFLQSIIDTASLPADDKTVDWLFSNPISDGGQYTGVSENIMKYGVVPAEVMNETYSSDNTSRLRQLIGLKLREDGLELRSMKASGKTDQEIAARKTAMLSEIYRMLALTLGEPPTEFEWTRCDASGNPVETKRYTPQSFYKEFAGNDLKDDYVMLMNDPTREYYKLYEIEYDRHNYDGKNWTYVNLPIEDIKKVAIASIKDGAMMYFSCDVGKEFDRKRGVLDTGMYDYGALLGVSFGMDKRQRIATHASASSHAMTLMAVDLDDKGNPRKWMVENSWGPGANDGHLIMTDRWFDEYMFRLVADKKYITPEIKKVLDQKPILLPAWDPMFADER